MMKRTLILVLITVLCLALISCGLEKKEESSKLQIVTTIFPPLDFAREIAGDRAEITMLLKPGAESHSFEPSPQDMKKIQEADLFVYTGGENDVWVEELLKSLGDKKPKTLKMIDTVATLEEEIVEGMEHEHDHGHHHEAIEEKDIKERSLEDFKGSYQSVYPLFADDTMKDYVAEKAKDKEVTPEEMKAEFLKKRQSDYQHMNIDGNTVKFKTEAGEQSGSYVAAGYRAVKDDEGHITGVWYMYQLEGDTQGLPKYLALNDHEIAPKEKEHEHEHGDKEKEKHEHEHEHELAHFHIRYGDDMDKLVEKQDWAPTFYDAAASKEEIRDAIASHGHAHAHEHEVDEHVWTSPANAVAISKQMTQLMAELAPQDKAEFESRLDAYVKKLEELDQSFREVVNQGQRKTIVFGDRFPLRYFAEAYGLKYFAAFSGCSTETEASANTVAFLIDKVKAEKIPVVFAIELSTGLIADTIQEATGAEKLTFYSCHNLSKEQMDAGESYLSMMQKNVESLRKALD